MPLAELDRVRIADYADQGDREDEPVFVGREDLFDLVARNARMAAKGRTKGRTICLAGPPGIGKTAFLSELESRSAKPGRIGNGIVCLKIPFAALSRTETLALRMEEALPEEWRPRRKPIPYLLDKLGGGSVRIAGFGASEQGKASGAAGAMFPWEAMPEMLKRVPSSLVVCLYVDEAHGLQPSAGLPDGEARNIAAGDLHEGAPPHVPPSGRRVFSLFAGQAHTPEVLEKSISWRLADGNLQYMRNLSEAESLRYVERTLDYLGASGVDPERHALADWVVGECGGFPHHLRSAMCAVAEGLLRADDGLALSALDGTFVSERLRRRRVLYYRVRTKGAVGQARSELGALMRAWSRRAQPVDQETGQDDLDDLIDGLPDRRRVRLAKLGVEDGAGLMRKMVERGALMTDGAGGGCRCPIDPLSAWMESGGHVFRKPFPSLPRPSPRNMQGGVS